MEPVAVKGARTLRALAIATVIAASLAGGIGAAAIVTDERELSVATVSLSVSPFHDGALDIYVPVVDWGARFPAVRAPARLEIDVRAVNRQAVLRLAGGASIDVENVRAQARDAIAAFLRKLLVATLLAAAAAGAVAALAVRGGAAPRLRLLMGLAGGSAVVLTAAMALTLPPRGQIDRPEYYAFGPDIPRALEALKTTRRSAEVLDEELNAQLVGIARLVSAPAGRRPVQGAPRVTIASDLHNNVLAVPILERAADGGPVLFAGDLTDRGSPIEAALVERVVRTGRPFVFVTGNHDSDSLARRLVRRGAVVLSRDGRLDRQGRPTGAVVQEVAGLRVAGYSDPFERLSSEDYRDRYEQDPGLGRRLAFAAWMDRLVGEVDIVIVHDIRLAERALDKLREDPPAQPLVFVSGHTHRPSIERFANVSIVNGGSVGGGGTGNLDAGTPVGLARLSFVREPHFEPLAADLVEIEPGSGAATARRERLD